MGVSVAHFDRAINGHNMLRLAVMERVVRHMGNTLDEEILAEIPAQILDSQGWMNNPMKGGSSVNFFVFDWKPVKWLLLRLYDRIFRMYYKGRM